MTPDSRRTPHGQATALVIQPSPSHLHACLSAVSSVGLDTVVADTFQDARAALVAHEPVLLLTALRLYDYNGLHLVMRGTSQLPDLAAIVTTDGPDPVLQLETEGLGATFVVLPQTQSELVAAICRTLFRRGAGVAAEPVRAPFERRSPRPGPDEVASPAERRRDVADVIQSLAR